VEAPVAQTPTSTPRLRIVISSLLRMPRLILLLR
jgi:hypothetical protein